jgi:cytochrome c oxidase assembly protein subunit 15
LPWAALGALGLVLVQGILGGLTVTQFLRFDIVTAHLGTATLFLGLLMTIGVCLFPAPTLLTPVGPLTWVGPLAALVTYGQLVLGGLVASQWALHQCIGDQALCAVMNNHLWGVAPTLLMVALTLIVTWAKVPWGSPIAWSAMGALLLVCLQIGLGIGTYLLQLSIPVVTVLHLITGVSLFASLVVTSTLALRSQS